jgi:hypothetical protein
MLCRMKASKVTGLGTEISGGQRRFRDRSGPNGRRGGRRETKSLTTTTGRDDVYAFIFRQKGLMGGLGLQGSKITKVSR